MLALIGFAVMGTVALIALAIPVVKSIRRDQRAYMIERDDDRWLYPGEDGDYH